MDDQTFDRLTRLFASGSSRRSVLKGLLGLGAAAAGGTNAGSDADARTLRKRPRVTTAPPPSCLQPNQLCGGICCEPGKCHDGHCCPNTSDVWCGPAGCCDASLCAAGSTCCAPGQQVCGSVCCPSTAVCARSGNTDFCCDPSQCCDGECCNDADCYAAYDEGCVFCVPVGQPNANTCQPLAAGASCGQGACDVCNAQGQCVETPCPTTTTTSPTTPTEPPTTTTQPATSTTTQSPTTTSPSPATTTSAQPTTTTTQAATSTTTQPASTTTTQAATTTTTQEAPTTTTTQAVTTTTTQSATTTTTTQSATTTTTTQSATTTTTTQAAATTPQPVTTQAPTTTSQSPATTTTAQTCKPDFAECDGFGQCCSGFCGDMPLSPVCGGEPRPESFCLGTTGAECESSFCCASGRCSDGTCQPCLEASEPCDEQSDCCRTTGGGCAARASGATDMYCNCNPLGAACEQHFDCCSERCEREVDTEPGTCQLCLPPGELCNHDNDCCTRSDGIDCVWGGALLNYCNCIPAGTACREGVDCCNGFCDENQLCAEFPATTTTTAAATTTTQAATTTTAATCRPAELIPAGTLVVEGDPGGCDGEAICCEGLLCTVVETPEAILTFCLDSQHCVNPNIDCDGPLGCDYVTGECSECLSFGNYCDSDDECCEGVCLHNEAVDYTLCSPIEPPTTTTRGPDCTNEIPCVSGATCTDNRCVCDDGSLTYCPGTETCIDPATMCCTASDCLSREVPEGSCLATDDDDNPFNLCSCSGTNQCVLNTETCSGSNEPCLTSEQCCPGYSNCQLFGDGVSRCLAPPTCVGSYASCTADDQCCGERTCTGGSSQTVTVCCGLDGSECSGGSDALKSLNCCSGRCVANQCMPCLGENEQCDFHSNCCSRNCVSNGTVDVCMSSGTTIEPSAP